MNLKIIRLVLSMRRNYFISIFILIMMNVGLYIYASSYQEPKLSSLRNTWSEKRLLVAGTGLMDAASVYRQGTSDLAAWRTRISPKRSFDSGIADRSTADMPANDEEALAESAAPEVE